MYMEGSSGKSHVPHVGCGAREDIPSAHKPNCKEGTLTNTFLYNAQKAQVSCTFTQNSCAISNPSHHLCSFHLATELLLVTTGSLDPLQTIH